MQTSKRLGSVKCKLGAFIKGKIKCSLQGNNLLKSLMSIKGQSLFRKQIYNHQIYIHVSFLMEALANWAKAVDGSQPAIFSSLSVNNVKKQQKQMTLETNIKHEKVKPEQLCTLISLHSFGHS